MRKFRSRIILFAIVILLLAGLISLAVYLEEVADYRQMVKETSFDEIDISSVPDGVYVGEYDVNFIYAKVEVTVQNGKITGIDILEHKNERGQSAEALISEIVGEQRIDVDAISGATNSSTVIKKAVENALKGER